MPFVEPRAKPSEIVERVAEHGDTYVVAKRQKPVAVIIGIDRYGELSGTGRYIEKIGGKRTFRIGGDTQLLLEAASLTALRDPYDRLIVAQARVAGLPLMTGDEEIYQSSLVHTVWD